MLFSVTASTKEIPKQVEGSRIELGRLEQLLPVRQLEAHVLAGLQGSEAVRASGRPGVRASVWKATRGKLG